MGEIYHSRLLRELGRVEIEGEFTNINSCALNLLTWRFIPIKSLLKNQDERSPTLGISNMEDETSLVTTRV